MVEFRNILSKPKAPKKKEIPESKTDSIKNDQFSFRNLVSKEQEKPTGSSKAEIDQLESHEIIGATQVERKKGVRFKDIYPSEASDTLPREASTEKRIAAQPETASSDEIESQDVIDDSKASSSEFYYEQSHDTRPHLSPAVEKARQLLYDEVAKYIREVFAAVRRRRKFSIAGGFKIMHQMVETQPPYDPLFINAIHQDNTGEYIIYHSVNVSIFAIKMAQYLGYSKERQEEIGMAGLLHDVGAGLVPKNVLYQENKLSQREISILRERPLNSFKILRQFGDQYMYLAVCASQVYERIDGSGYPNGLMGDEIKEYAQIIGLVDIYEALIHSRPQRVKFLHLTAVKEIIKTHKKGFKKEHLKALLNSFSIFPLSSYVRLNSNAIGKVIETYPDQPLRPKIIIEYNSQNQKVLTERIVDLTENSLLHIIDSVSEVELQSFSIA